MPIEYSRLRSLGHVERSNGWIKKCTEMVVDGNRRLGGQKKKWKSLVSQDMKLIGTSIDAAKDRSRWREVIHKRVNYQKTSTQ